MALITCPECKKEISDRAHSCPLCGFPLADFFEEMQLKEEEKRIEELKNIKAIEIRKLADDYSCVHEFCFLNHKIALTINQKVCSCVSFFFSEELVRVRSDIEDELVNIDADHPSDYSPIAFGKKCEDFILGMIEPFLDISFTLLDIFVGKNKYNRQDVIDELLLCSKYDDMVVLLNIIHKRLYEKYDLENKMLSTLDYYSYIPEPGPFIDSFYAFSVSDFIKESISTEIINGVAGKLLSKGADKRRKRMAKIDSMDFIKSKLEMDLEIYTVLYGRVAIIAEDMEKLLLKMLIDYDNLFEIYNYPKSPTDYIEMKEKLDDKYLLMDEKIDYLCKCIESNPGDINLYDYAVTSIPFDKSSLIEFIKFVEFMDFDEMIMETIEEKFNVNDAFYSDEKINLYLSRLKESLCYLDNKKFDSLESREKYINEKRGEIL